VHLSEPFFEAYGLEGWEFESLRVRSRRAGQSKFDQQRADQADRADPGTVARAHRLVQVLPATRWMFWGRPPADWAHRMTAWSDLRSGGTRSERSPDDTGSTTAFTAARRRRT